MGISKITPYLDGDDADGNRGIWIRDGYIVTDDITKEEIDCDQQLYGEVESNFTTTREGIEKYLKLKIYQDSKGEDIYETVDGDFTEEEFEDYLSQFEISLESLVQSWITYDGTEED